MSSPSPPSEPLDEAPQGDPWHAVGYLTAGVCFYGLIGWALDRWLGTSFLVAIGILVGAGLGLYLTWVRFRPRRVEESSQDGESS
ncbi:MAG TPA: AtpZ/AtpI family protein [Nocardioides sp.]|uniref:AtpZ/AtpI family protein n=1 Tax=Nocardioides sp. TaxID=35761 RepID=UPI002BB04200|nr:AtpZ/AtpI family protein [Nocardioides sp.]HQR25811.1 AtpZ/AtpI family protein [Nocardioides sp.]